MKALLFAVALPLTWGYNDDLFNYRGTDEEGRDFGPRDWEEVDCDDLETCVSSECRRSRIGRNEAYPHLLRSFFIDGVARKVAFRSRLEVEEERLS